MTIGPLMEIILYVQDMAAQVAFYRDTLGFRVLYPSEVSDFSSEYWVTLDTGPCILALHAGGKRRLGQDTPKLVFRVEDIQAARTALIERGVRLDPARSAAPGVWVCDGFDPEGNPLSIEAHAPLAL